MDIANIIQTIAIYALPVLFAITLHEAAHGYVARYFGDDTAWVLGRVTLNPLKHIDPVGTILMPAVMYLTTFAIPGGPFILGYAKPVPVRFGNLRNPKRDMIWVALAGPAANLLQALLWGILLLVLSGMDVSEPYFLAVSKAGITVNVVMFVFNLFPLPPLDGGRILVGLLPYQHAALVSRIEPWGFFIVMALVISGVLSNLWMRPLMSLTYGLLDILLLPVSMVFR